MCPRFNTGAEAVRKAFQEWFDLFQGPITYESRDLSIAASGDVVFTHSLDRTSGTLKTGQKTGHWLRRTDGLRKVNGKWLITHEHASLPADLKSGKVVRDLKP